jgi:hypothetical protein
VKIIWYYTFESRAAIKGASKIHGFAQSGPLLAEVGKINHDVKRMEGILSAAVPISSEPVGGAEHGLGKTGLGPGDLHPERVSDRGMATRNTRSHKNDSLNSCPFVLFVAICALFLSVMTATPLKADCGNGACD